MIAAEVIELLIKFDGDPDELAREVLRLRAELAEKDRQIEAMENDIIERSEVEEQP
jgi:hypothetical protein